MSLHVEFIFNRANKTYRQGDTVKGTLSISTKSDFKHEGLYLSFEGHVLLQLSPKNAGLLEAISSANKPMQLANWSKELSVPGIFSSGKTDYPFEFKLEPRTGRVLYESYHGVYVSVQYQMRFWAKRSFPNKDVEKTVEFICEYHETSGNKASTKPLTFSMTADSVQTTERGGRLPRFLIKGSLKSTQCCLNNALAGEITVEESVTPVKSIELQLVRVETCGAEQGFTRDSTEIQNIQICEGNPCPGLAIPIYMIFPRLFTCPSLETPNFKIDFELNVIVIFDNDDMVMKCVPLLLFRF